MGYELFWSNPIAIDTLAQHRVLEQFAAEENLSLITHQASESGITNAYSFLPTPRTIWPDDLVVSFEAGKPYLLFHTGSSAQVATLKQLLTFCIHQQGVAGEFIEE